MHAVLLQAEQLAPKAKEQAVQVFRVSSLAWELATQEAAQVIPEVREAL